MSNYEIIECDSAEDFLKELSLSNPAWWEENPNCEWIFRGQNSDHQLIPGLYRNHNKNNKGKLFYQEKFDKIHTKLVTCVPDMKAAIKNQAAGAITPKLEDNQIRKLEEIIKAAYVEIALTEKFLLKCNKIRLYTPSLKLFDKQDVEKSSVEHFYDFLIDPIGRFVSHPSTEVRKIFFSRGYPETWALARHHGIPSRLIDWSHDPLVAAFFSGCKIEENSDICVWALNKKYLSSHNTGGRITFHEKLCTTGLEFLHLQKGLFTDMLCIEHYYFIYGKWPTLDEYLLETYTNQLEISQNLYLKKIILKSQEKNNLLVRLDRMGINQYSLMPTYDNVAQSLLNQST